MFRRRNAPQGGHQEVVLPTARLRFHPDQLQRLNCLFLKRVQEKSARLKNDQSLLLARSVVERLVQRLICGAGSLDPRFSSKFLISNHEQLDRNLPSRSLEYLLRLDSLSTPRLYSFDSRPRYSIIETDREYPPGYARIRLHGKTLKTWSDCSNSAGYLRRDKVQARLVELLAKAAASEQPNSPLHVDESLHCATPGKIVDASTLHQILQVSSHKHVFYGPGGSVPRFPDPRDFRLAIVDEPDGIRLKVEFLSPALSETTIDVKILLAIGSGHWPSSADFPTRVTLGHTDCLLYHQAAQSGMYLVGFGVQSSAWQIRVPAAQDVILNHYGGNSTIRTILDVLIDILEEMDFGRAQKKHTYKILNRYIVLSLLLKRLEEHSSSPGQDLITWSPMYLSSHVLLLLDKVIEVLRAENLPNYFFKKANLLVNPGHLCEDDYLIEANYVKGILLKLLDESSMCLISEDFNRILAAQQTETLLLHKWKDLIDNLSPPLSTRGRRFFFARSRSKSQVAHTEYTGRQLEYIGLLLEQILNVKQNTLNSDSSFSEETIKLESPSEDNHLEDVIYLLVTIMDQARDKYLSSSNPIMVKNRSKLKAQFNISTAKLVEVIRRDKDTSQMSFEDDLSLVRIILKWLYHAMDENRRSLAPILRPYLNTLFACSHAISWHLDFIKKRSNRDELDSLGAFAVLVNDGTNTPAEALMDAVNKQWDWAKGMLKMVENNTLRVIFIAERGKVYRHILSLPSYQKKIESGIQTVDNSGKVKRQRNEPFSGRDYFHTILNQKFKEEYSEVTPQHDLLKKSSPLTMILEESNRRGEHRGYGDILKSLQSMQKLNMFQQVTSNLPQEDRAELLEMIQEMQSVKPKKSTKRWSSTLPSKGRNEGNSEKYTPTEESAGIRICEGGSGRKDVAQMGTLIGSCRAARIREDSSVLLFQDSFRIKSLLNKSESFKF